MLNFQLLLCGIQVCFSQVLCDCFYMCVVFVGLLKTNNSMCLHNDTLVP